MSLKKDIQAGIIHAVETVRQTNPMAGSVTNTVTINFVANAQLAVGGSAAMVYLPDEAQSLAQAGGAAYINLGTLTPVYEKTLPAMAKIKFCVTPENHGFWILWPSASAIFAPGFCWHLNPISQVLFVEMPLKLLRWPGYGGWPAAPAHPMSGGWIPRIR